MVKKPAQSSWLFFLRILFVAVFVSVMVIGSLFSLHYGLEEPHLAHPVHVLNPDAAKRGLMPRPAARLESMAVVLPCAQEGQFAVKTVWSIWNTSNPNLLREILVVDDGSQPPLEYTLRDGGLIGEPWSPPVKVLRHEKTIGLIGAKNTGGYAAVSDVIVFLDCHVKPRPGWDEAIVKQMSRHGDHRTVVVPQIGMLNADTWEEIPSNSFHRACFVSWDIDFPWIAAEYVRNDEVPVMSGGLLAISRQWWHETEGYDPEMLGWGGENIDQSLRSWLCGGRIELAEGAIIAHMFRVTDKPQTHAKYHAEGADVGKNKLRAAKAWMGDFVDKVLDNPEFGDFKTGVKTLGNMSHFDRVKEKLQCTDFTHFLDKFHYIYFDSGYIPKEIFQIQEVTTGFCLERQNGPEHGSNPVSLVPCLPTHEEAVMKQQWQLSNARYGKECCSGLMHWNTLQCLDTQGRGSAVNTWECQIDGMNANQRIELTASGELKRDGKECAGPSRRGLGSVSHATRQATDVSVVKLDGGKIRLSVPTKDKAVKACASPGPDSNVIFHTCNDLDHDETFTIASKQTGFEVRDVNGRCLDAAGEGKPILYMCYEEVNPNQIWIIDDDNHLCLAHDRSQFCLHIEWTEDMARKPGSAELKNCGGNDGQKFHQERRDEGGYFLRHPSTDLCLTSGRTADGAAGPSLSLGPCEPNAYWEEKPDSGLKFGASGSCIDTAGGSRPILYPCYTPQVDTQAFSYDAIAQAVRVKGNKAGGKHRAFSQCVDVDPLPPQSVEVKDCSTMRHRGVQWKKLNTIVPHEWKIWQKMQQRHAITA
mmetsp:Transcript_44445/g.105308  ORF Transcript_44445/g.105308 Transcript_44445/m.105308 type:complete len:813 (-) Transcript_44445:138-2576(-)